MTHRLISKMIFFMLIFVATTANTDELKFPDSQLTNLGVKFGTPVTAELADSFQAPARVRIPPSNDFAVIPSLPGTIKKLGVSTGDQVIARMPIQETKGQ